ncbi:hypothetical protein PoB_006944800 [Plakobranchus ocellatus]|uniref:Uncharacterized protein n=1 Tax=Plakobranchus ocellatus TaxID=259542 RepID=A0AAV4DFE1_9GAST|nr:hypothetical protein PoB_006944800 [Plakobranchus ocellatus]
MPVALPSDLLGYVHTSALRPTGLCPHLCPQNYWVMSTALPSDLLGYVHSSALRPTGLCPQLYPKINLDVPAAMISDPLLFDSLRRAL